jgi:hypothetical protein
VIAKAPIAFGKVSLKGVMQWYKQLVAFYEVSGVNILGGFRVNNIRKDMACNLLTGTSEYILQFFLLVFMLVMNFLDLLNYVHFSK